MPDRSIPTEVRIDATKVKGYFIYPSQLFANVVATAHNNPRLNTDLATIFRDIEASHHG